MSLLPALAKEGIVWSISPYLLERPNKRPRPVLRVVLSISASGTTITYDTIAHSRDMEDLVGEAMQHHLPHHPATKAYRYSKGDGLVTLNEGALEQLGVLLHTAMRKVMQGPLSAILHSSWQQCSSKTIHAALDMVKPRLQALFEKGAVSRQVFAMELRDSLQEALDELDSQARRTPGGVPLSLRHLLLALQEVSFTDWMWALPAYIVTEVPVAELA